MVGWVNGINIRFVVIGIRSGLKLRGMGIAFLPSLAAVEFSCIDIYLHLSPACISPLIAYTMSSQIW